jgi:hypothetical protein
LHLSRKQLDILASFQSSLLQNTVKQSFADLFSGVDGYNQEPGFGWMTQMHVAALLACLVPAIRFQYPQ